ncbi:MAG TPA: EVE domain-containing protein [Kofleriaceae bacterium]|nr:EVE domain-containing protein [Kofleriaceae bacterium]
MRWFRAMGKQYWLMKSEPDAFGIADLERVKVEPWTGVRSFFARAHMRAMSVGDDVLFHHSNASPPGVAGMARVVKTQVVDETQFDPASPYHDPRATRDKPVWDCVEVEYVGTLPHFVSMDRMRAEPRLADMILLQGRGMRLSVQPVTEGEYAAVVDLGNTEPPPPPLKAPRAPKAKSARPTKPAKAKPRKAAKAGIRAAKGKPTPAAKKTAARPRSR